VLNIGLRHYGLDNDIEQKAGNLAPKAQDYSDLTTAVD
jgi:hypothetical protein